MNIFDALFPAASKRSVYDNVKFNTWDSVMKRAALQILEERIEAEEGLRLDVYKDSRGYLTVGYGHKVLPSDNLKLGQVITLERAKKLYEGDINDAINAAYDQMTQLPYSETASWLASLTEVNYQLGIYWPTEFTTTWKALKRGDTTTAINNLKKSAWAIQTPRRVNNFVTALNEVNVIGPVYKPSIG